MEQGSTCQQSYWNELVRMRIHELYLEEYLHRTQIIDRGINIVLAIASSASIAAWAVWQNYPLLWAIIIGASQVITAIKPFLPFRNRLKAIPALLRDLDKVYFEAEYRWFDVSHGQLTERQIFQLHSKISKRRAEAIQRSLGASPLPTKTKYLDRARDSATVYFHNRFPEVQQDDRKQ
jgi:hypothetical protein